ncbi:MAG: type II secretion system GspH family protein [Nitrospirota bacterium]
MRYLGQRGFTLLESILIITLVAVAGTMMFTIANSPFTNAADVNRKTSNAFKLEVAMENIIADYIKNYKNNSSWSQFDINIGAEGSPAVQANVYGSYILKDKHFIKYVSSVETTDTSQILSAVTIGAALKVTIADDDGNSLTTIFSRYK